MIAPTLATPWRQSHVVPAIVGLHIEEVAALLTIRSVREQASNCTLSELRGLDDRVAANLDGIALAGEEGARLCERELEAASAGVLFAMTTRAIEDASQERLDRALSIAEAVPECLPGVLAAFQWVGKRHLRGVALPLTKSSSPVRRVIGIDACAAHRVDVGAALTAWVVDRDPLVRVAALRAAGQMGRLDLQRSVNAAMTDDDRQCREEAAVASVLLGDRNRGPQVLLGGTHAIDGGRDFAMAVALQAMSVARGVDVLREMARDPAALRCAIKGSGVVGDPKLVHWLIRQMAAPQMARVAGEAFTLITGADLSALRLELDEAIKPAAGPSDEPGDDDVAMDADDDLPWPDAEKVERWWMANAHAFSKGSRHLLGVRASSSHCVEILRSGFQRQRLLAAQQRSLSEPGTPVFNTRAPSWRQQRWLAALAG